MGLSGVGGGELCRTSRPEEHEKKEGLKGMNEEEERRNDEGKGRGGETEGTTKESVVPTQKNDTKQRKEEDNKHGAGVERKINKE